jgi:PAS domain S-box-containing protein
VKSENCTAATALLLDELRAHQIELELQNEELRRVQAELEASRAHYLELYDLSSIGYCTLSESGVILEANLIFATLLNMERGELLAQSLSRFVAQSDADSFYLLCKQVLQTGSRSLCELRMRQSDGALLWGQLAATTAREKGGELVLRLALNDITERKRLEQELVDVAEARQRTLGQELHDNLGQQIAAIGYQARALEKLTENPGAAKLAASIASQAHSAVMQCKQLAQGLLPFELEAHGLHSALQAFVSGINQSYGLDCALECSEEVIVGDPHLALNLYRIVQEAVNNAVRHSGARHLRVSLVQEEGSLTLSICDDGCGFAHREGKSAGMGLKIMQYRAMQFGATLQFLSRSEGGTEVRLGLRLM